MRRPMRLGLVAAVLLLVIALGGYTAFWFTAAGRVADGFTEWAQSLRAQNLDLSWQQIRVGGFPLKFDVELSEARLIGPAGELHLKLLSGSALPWNFRLWRLAAPDGLTATAAPAAAATLTVQSATGSVLVGSDGGATVWLALARPAGEAGMRLAAQDALIWLSLPPHPPQGHTEPMVGLALDLHQVSLPAVPPPFHNPLDEIAVGVTVMGAIPAAPPARAAAAWRDAGGTLELDHVAARWGSLAVTGSGTLALDANLQPMGAFSGGVEGYDELMAALVAAGRMRPGDAQLARLALTMLARAGPNGRPQIATSFTIQQGQMFLGPAKLGPAPRINWE